MIYNEILKFSLTGRFWADSARNGNGIFLTVWMLRPIPAL